MANLLVDLVRVMTISLIVLVVLLGTDPVTPEGRPQSPIPVPDPPAGRSVYFAPIGDFPVADAEALVAHYRQKFDLTIEILPSIPFPDGSFDGGRNQVIAERLIEAIGAIEVAADPDAIVIGLTGTDMYIAELSWRYAYALRDRGHLVVISTGRMDALRADQARQTRRLQKMVTKMIGVLYYGLPESFDPGSVLYRDIGGPQDLDRMSEDF